MSRSSSEKRADKPRCDRDEPVKSPSSNGESSREAENKVELKFPVNWKSGKAVEKEVGTAAQEIATRADQLTRVSALPIVPILLLVSTTSICICAFVLLLIVWSGSGKTDELIQQAADKTTEQAAFKTSAQIAEMQKSLEGFMTKQDNQLSRLPESFSDQIRSQVPPLASVLTSATERAAALSKAIADSDTQIKVLGDQKQRDEDYQESLQLRGRVDQIEEELKQTRHFLSLLTQNSTQGTVATILLCADNSRLRFARLKRPIRDSMVGRAANFYPNAKFAIFRINNATLIEPPYRDFEGKENSSAGNSNDPNFGENLRELSTLQFPANAVSRRVIAIVSEDSEPPENLENIELNAILVQIIMYSDKPNTESEVTATIARKKFEKWAAKCNQSGGRFVYLPIPTPEGQLEAKDTLFQTLVMNAISDLLFAQRIISPLINQPIQEKAGTAPAAPSNRSNQPAPLNPPDKVKG